MMKELSLEEAKKLHARRFVSLPSKTLNGDRWKVSVGKEGYPESLLHLSDPPEILYGI